MHVEIEVETAVVDPYRLHAKPQYHLGSVWGRGSGLRSSSSLRSASLSALVHERRLLIASLCIVVSAVHERRSSSSRSASSSGAAHVGISVGVGRCTVGRPGRRVLLADSAAVATLLGWCSQQPGVGQGNQEDHDDGAAQSPRSETAQAVCWRSDREIPTMRVARIALTR